jgi:adenosylcobinamide-GDP ribazoletransferase
VKNDFLTAIQFLTRLPTGKQSDYQPGAAGTAISWYGPTGLIIGLLMLVTGWITNLLLPPAVVAAVVLFSWVAVTGALHLDGLGDCGDAWMGGHTPQRMLEIMKDTSCGIGAIVVVVLVLLVKFSALTLIVQNGDWLLLLFAPVLARVSLSLVIYHFPYCRTNGLGSGLKQTLNINTLLLSGLAVSLLLCLISLKGFVYGLLACALACAIIYWIFIKPLRGATGDVYGALVEVTEALVLIGLIITV